MLTGDVRHGKLNRLVVFSAILLSGIMDGIHAAMQAAFVAGAALAHA